MNDFETTNDGETQFSRKELEAFRQTGIDPEDVLKYFQKKKKETVVPQKLPPVESVEQPMREKALKIVEDSNDFPPHSSAEILEDTEVFQRRRSSFRGLDGGRLEMTFWKN